MPEDWNQWKARPETSPSYGHRITKEARHGWTADYAVRYAFGVMARTQEKERGQQRPGQDDGKSYARGNQVDQSVGDRKPADSAS